jgi:hypothetical protein
MTSIKLFIIFVLVISCMMVKRWDSNLRGVATPPLPPLRVMSVSSYALYYIYVMNYFVGPVSPVGP